ncbi:MAG: NVEALA domain-containing protein [Tannerellaceae bacterium]|nr:NVEALA domain-containing protein [Tannerellaceae bacterium]
MKKNFIKITFVALFAIVSAYSLYYSKKRPLMADLVFDNIEALASGEITTPTNCPAGTILCVWVTYPGGSVTYYKRS